MIGNQMIATTLYLPKDWYSQIGQIALIEKKPKAQVVREAIEVKLKGKMRTANATKKFVDALTKIQFSGGITDLAKNHDHYLWD